MIVEVRQGVGGDEAALWAGDVFRMLTPLRRAARLQDRDPLRERERDRRLQGGRLRRQGRRRVLGLQVRGRHAPRAARARDRVAGSDPHLDRHRRGDARGGGGRDRDRRERPQDRRLPLDRPRRPERQHDRLGRAHHPPADRRRRRDAGREVTAPEPAEGDARAPRPALRARAREGAGRALGGPQARRSAPASARRRSAPTTSPRTGSPTTGSSSRCTGSTRSWTATSRSSRRRSRPRIGGSRSRPPASMPGFSRLDPSVGASPAWRGRPSARSCAAPPSTSRRRDPTHRGSMRSACSRRRSASSGSSSTRRFDRPLTPPELAAARELVARRARREPLQYVLGEWGFRRLTLTVDRRALIPRPETEILVERALAPRRRARPAARARRRHRLRRDRARDRRRASGCASSPGSTARTDALALAAENVARTGLAVELARSRSLRGAARRPVGPGRLEPARTSRRPTSRARARGARLGAARSAGRRRRGRGGRPRGRRRARARAAALVLEVGAGQTEATAALLEELGFAEVRVTAGPGGARSGRRGPTGVSEVESVVAGAPSRGARRSSDRHGLRPRLRRLRRAAGSRSLPAQGAGRRSSRPPLLAASVDVLLECIPELGGRPAAIARALFPGRSRSSSRTRPGASPGSCASRPDTIGVRVPVLSGPAAAIVARLGVVVATSANLPGGPDPCRLDDVPAADPRGRRRCARRR